MGTHLLQFVTVTLAMSLYDTGLLSLSVLFISLEQRFQQNNPLLFIWPLRRGHGGLGL